MWDFDSFSEHVSYLVYGANKMIGGDFLWDHLLSNQV